MKEYVTNSTYVKAVQYFAKDYLMLKEKFDMRITEKHGEHVFLVEGIEMPLRDGDYIVELSTFELRVFKKKEFERLFNRTNLARKFLQLSEELQQLAIDFKAIEKGVALCGITSIAEGKIHVYENIEKLAQEAGIALQENKNEKFFNYKKIRFFELK